MILLVLFVLGVAGLSYWTGYARLTEGLRTRMENFLRANLWPDQATFVMCGVKCMACTSWWFGFVIGLTRGHLFFQHWGLPEVPAIERALVLAFVACFSSFTLGVHVGLIKR